jgi:hypothetical protein
MTARPSGPLQAWLNIARYPQMLNMRYTRIYFATTLFSLGHFPQHHTYNEPFSGFTFMTFDGVPIAV